MNDIKPDEITHIRHQKTLLEILDEFDKVCKKLSINYLLFAGSLLGAVRHKGFIPWDDDLDVIMLREDYEKFLAEAENFIDKEKFYLQKEFSEHWPLFFSKLRMNGTTCLEKYHPKDPLIHQGIYIDIFPCDKAAKTEFGRKIQFMASKVVIAKALDKRGYDTDSAKKKIFMAFCRIFPEKPFIKLVKNGKSDKVVHSFFGGASSYSKNVYPRKWFEERMNMRFESDEFPVSLHYNELLSLLYGNYMELPPPEKRLCKQHAILVDFENSYEKYADYRDGMTFEVHTRSIR